MELGINDKKGRWDSHNGGVAWPSLRLKESFRDGFLLAIGWLGLSDLLLSTEETADARQGKQLFGRSPQLSNTPVSFSLPLSSTQTIDISSRKTGFFTSFWGSSDFNTESASLDAKNRVPPFLETSPTTYSSEFSTIGSFAFSCWSEGGMQGTKAL